ncbi:MAG: HAD-IB family phosphatase [Clostridia bacterium]|nr:HAD-IB family phosphatase [Clostridia bacterium]
MSDKIKKAVVFDFDGTLSYKSINSWKSIWQYLGYSIEKDSYFSKLFMMFMNREISHQKWCDLTCDAFKDKQMTLSALSSAIQSTNLISGFENTMSALKNSDYSLHIVSGSIEQIITGVLKNNTQMFDSIKANKMFFNDGKYLERIEGTKFDFEGKALFIEKLKEKGLQAKDIVFVGNSHNDEWACQSGCKTICLNPKDTCETNSSVWNNVVKSNDIRSILPLIFKDKNLQINDMVQEN